MFISRNVFDCKFPKIIIKVEKNIQIVANQNKIIWILYQMCLYSCV